MAVYREAPGLPGFGRITPTGTVAPSPYKIDDTLGAAPSSTPTTPAAPAGSQPNVAGGANTALDQTAINLERNQWIADFDMPRQDLGGLSMRALYYKYRGQDLNADTLAYLYGSPDEKQNLLREVSHFNILEAWAPTYSNLFGGPPALGSPEATQRFASWVSSLAGAGLDQNLLGGWAEAHRAITGETATPEGILGFVQSQGGRTAKGAVNWFEAGKEAESQLPNVSDLFRTYLPEYAQEYDTREELQQVYSGEGGKQPSFTQRLEEARLRKKYATAPSDVTSGFGLKAGRLVMPSLAG